MAAINEKGSPQVSTIRLHLLLDFCRTVVRSDENQLQHAMHEYERFLALSPRRS